MFKRLQSKVITVQRIGSSRMPLVLPKAKSLIGGFVLVTAGLIANRQLGMFN